MKKRITAKITAFCFAITLALTTTAINAEGAKAKPALTGPPTTLFSYDNLYVGEDGETHFRTITVDYKRLTYADNIPPIWAALNGKWKAKHVSLAGNSPGWDARPLHPGNYRQVFIVLTGVTAFIASDGETREYGPGEMILMEDANSKGHGSFVPSKSNSMVAIIPLEEE